MLKYTFIILFTISQICNAQNSSSIQPKSHAKAFLLSFISTAVPIGVGTGLILHSNNQAPVNYGEAVLGTTLGVFGVMFAPGLGHIYAQREKPFKGIYTRLIGVGIAGGVTQARQAESEFDEGVERMAQFYLNRAQDYPAVMGGGKPLGTPGSDRDRFNMPWLQ